MCMPLAAVRAVSECLHTLSTCDLSHPQASWACEILKEISLRIATPDGIAERNAFGSAPDELWDSLVLAWRTLASRPAEEVYGNICQRTATISLARFTRNIVAGCTIIQAKVYPCELQLRSVAHMYSAHSFVNSPQEFIAARFVLQAISNIVASNESLTADLWAKYINLPEDKSIFKRFVTHPDDATCNVVLIFVINCISNHRGRMNELVQTYGGHRICVAILDRLSSHAEDFDECSGSQVFQSGWAIFKLLLLNDLGVLLFDTMEMEQQVITPPQTTLLKLVDAFIMEARENAYQMDDSIDHDHDLIERLAVTLRKKYFVLIGYARSSLTASLGDSAASKTDKPVVEGTDVTTDLSGRNDIPPNSELESGHSNPESPDSVSKGYSDTVLGLRQIDIILPRVCEAMVLITQCFCNLTLYRGTERHILNFANRQRTLLFEASLPDISNEGLVENIIDLLRLLDLFLPRLMFGKASWSTPHSHESPKPQADADRGFSFLKRDLVRLVGILCFENAEVQDRIRSCNGVPVIMNMCVTDERNPYLREHALFTLRNLLHGNESNKALVQDLEPMGVWDENGVLRDMPGVRK